MLEKKGKR